MQNEDLKVKGCGQWFASLFLYSGVVFVSVTTATAPGNSLQTTDEIIERIRQRIKDIPQIQHMATTTGYSMVSGD
jgi:Cu/Ag efflux pump CusA